MKNRILSYCSALLLGLLIFPGINYAQIKEIKSLIVEGDTKQRLDISIPEFSKLKHVNIESKDKNGVTHRYSGVPLNVILEKSGIVFNKQSRRENLSKYLFVKAADGYNVIFSLAELDKEFTDRVIILADIEDGKPIAKERGPFKLVVPADKIHARHSYLVTHLIIKSAKE